MKHLAALVGVGELDPASGWRGRGWHTVTMRAVSVISTNTTDCRDFGRGAGITSDPPPNMEDQGGPHCAGQEAQNDYLRLGGDGCGGRLRPRPNPLEQ